MCVKRGDHDFEPISFTCQDLALQATKQEKLFEKISRDIQSFETVEATESSRRTADLVAKKVAVINFKKESPVQQLAPKLELLIGFFIAPIGNFGIKSVPYKSPD